MEWKICLHCVTCVKCVFPDVELLLGETRSCIAADSTLQYLFILVSRQLRLYLRCRGNATTPLLTPALNHAANIISRHQRELRRRLLNHCDIYDSSHRP
jgi:hypothetical protein